MVKSIRMRAKRSYDAARRLAAKADHEVAFRLNALRRRRLRGEKAKRLEQQMEQVIQANRNNTVSKRLPEDLRSAAREVESQFASILDRIRS